MLLSNSLYDALLMTYTTQGNLQAQTFKLIKPAIRFSDSQMINVQVAGRVTGEVEFTELHINRQTYLNLFAEGPYQISLLVNDTFDAQQVMGSLGSNYLSIHPFEYVGETYDIGLGGLIGFMYFLVGGFIYIILNLVIKSIIQSRRKDFIIFRSIGASKNDLRKLLSLEQVLYNSFGFVLSFIPLIVMNTYIPLFKVMRYITVPIYMVFFIIFLLVLLSINNKFANKLFGKSVITTLKSE